MPPPRQSSFRENFGCTSGSVMRSTLARGRFFLRIGNGMRNCAQDEAETFDRPARFSRQCKHERMIDNGRKIARQDRIRRDLQGLRAHCFAKARYFQPHDCPNRFRRNVAFCDTGSASGQDQSATLLRKRTNRFLNSHYIVRYNCLRQNLPTCLFGKLFHGRSAKIGVFARARAV
jgi:hypothetical protein